MRIIQDSEDEDDLELEDARVAAPTRDAQIDQGTGSNNSSKAGDTGSGSTESLKRAIVAAHRMQFRDASFDGQNEGKPAEASPGKGRFTRSISHGASQSPVASPVHASKRRRTSSNGVVALSTTRDILPTIYDAAHAGRIDLHDNPNQGSTPERPWDFRGTLRNDWEHHEPMGLFAQTASSTIPNATATQERLLAEVLAPEFLGITADVETEPRSDPDARNYEPAKSSVPWSEYLKSSIRASEGTLQSAEPSPTDAPGNACKPTVLPIGSPCCSDRTVEPSASLQVPPISTIKEQPRNLAVIADGAQLQNSPCYAVGSPSRQAKQKLSSVPESVDDLIDTGMTMEPYQSRPSRSRSLHFSPEEACTQPQRLERAAKQTRRTRTSGEVEPTSTAATPEKVRQICDMGFTSSATKRALRQHNGDVTHTVDWLIANGPTPVDGLASQRLSTSKNKKSVRRGTSEQDRTINSVDGQATMVPTKRDNASSDARIADVPERHLQSAPTNPNPKSPSMVRVVIPGTRRPTNPPKFDGEYLATPTATLHDPEDTPEEAIEHREAFDRPILQLEESPVAGKQVQKGKKRGRGRPRKQPATTEPSNEELQDKASGPNESANVEDVRTEDKTPLPHEPEVFAPTEPTLDEHRVSDADNADLGPNATHATVEPPLPAKKVKETQDAIPSIGKAKTPYRVGLSKRARIAPLLRIVKK